MQIATSGGRVIVNGNRIGTSCVCCGPPNPCACCSEYPLELQATVSIGSVAEACYLGVGNTEVLLSSVLRHLWVRKAPWNQHGLASGSFTLSPTSVWSAGTQEDITSATRCRSYTYGSGLVVADDETVVEFRVTATAWGTVSGPCNWKVAVAFTQYIFPLFTPPAVIGGPKRPPSRVDSIFIYAPENLISLLKIGTEEPHQAFAGGLASIGSLCAGNTATASFNGTVQARQCTPQIDFSPERRCVRPVEGGVVVVSAGVPLQVSDVFSISDLSGAGELTDTPCPAQTASFSVTLSA